MDSQKQSQPNTFLIDLDKSMPDPTKMAQERRRVTLYTTALSTFAGAAIGYCVGITKNNFSTFPTANILTGSVLGAGIGYGASKLFPPQTYEERAYNLLAEMKDASQTSTGVKENIIKMLQIHDAEVSAAHSYNTYY